MADHDIAIFNIVAAIATDDYSLAIKRVVVRN